MKEGKTRLLIEVNKYTLDKIHQIYLKIMFIPTIQN